MTEALVITEFDDTYQIHFKSSDVPFISILKDGGDGRRLGELGISGLPNYRLIEIMQELKAQREGKDDTQDVSKMPSAANVLRATQ